MRILLLTSALLGGLHMVGQTTNEVVINTKGITSPIGRSMTHLTDTLGRMALEQVAASTGFQPCTSTIPSFGLGKNAHWLRFTLRNETEEPELLVSIPYPGIDEMDLYLNKGNGFQSIVRSGLSRDQGTSVSARRDFIFELPIPGKTSGEVLVRIRGFKHLHAPVEIGTAAAVNRSQTARYIAVGTYIGIMLVLFLYNFFVFAATKDRHYLFYILSVLALSCTQLSLQGQGPFNFIHVNGWLTSRAGLLFNLAAIPLGYEFARRFVNTRHYVPKMDRWVPLIYTVLGAIAIVYVLVDPWMGQELGNSISGIAALYLLTMGILSFRKGSRQAGFFLLAWSAFLVGVVLFVLKDEGVIAFTSFSVYAMPVGSAIEGVLLSFGLADRINVLRKEKEASQAEALNAARENERIIREQNTMLEEKVQERTH
ncbi:MAG TPA: 7TM diverse intracellular signaling domain-containing protein, partial [Flavobacteriales bacterium]|nr:7TM diverse intracellular signaling domain-containing protein [Flavobacteriales bacterium]